MAISGLRPDKSNHDAGFWLKIVIEYKIVWSTYEQRVIALDQCRARP